MSIQEYVSYAALILKWYDCVVGRHDRGDDESVRQSHQPRRVPSPDRRTAGNRHLLHGLVLCVSLLQF